MEARREQHWDKAGYSIGGETRNYDTARIFYVTDAMIWKMASLDAYQKMIVVIDEGMKADVNTHVNFALARKIAALGGKVVLLGAGIPPEITAYMGLREVSAEVRHRPFYVPVKYCGDLDGRLVKQV